MAVLPRTSALQQIDGIELNNHLAELSLPSWHYTDTNAVIFAYIRANREVQEAEARAQEARRKLQELEEEAEREGFY